jgi:hypothetical protein
VDQLIREGVALHRKRNVSISIVGVAKQSAVLSKLSLALQLEESFDRNYPCYVKVPEDIEEDCYNFDDTWLKTLETTDLQAERKLLYASMGNLYLVKFGNRTMDPVWPVDVAAWQVDRAEKILGQLTVDAQQGFPIPDYPMCIQKAHDYAKLSGMEVQILQDELTNAMTNHLSVPQRERVLRYKHLGQRIIDARYKEG